MLLHVKESNWLCSVDNGADSMNRHSLNYDAFKKITHFGRFLAVADGGGTES